MFLVAVCTIQQPSKQLRGAIAATIRKFALYCAVRVAAFPVPHGFGPAPRVSLGGLAMSLL